jgi:hypothetical protein
MSKLSRLLSRFSKSQTGATAPTVQGQDETSSRSQSHPPLPSGYEMMTRFSEEDVFIVGYPKSGNTWFQDLIAGAAYGVIPEFAPPVLAQNIVPDVHAMPFYMRLGTPMYFKSHSLPTPAYKRVVYLLRDGRDAMVSYYHHLLAQQKDGVDFLKLVQTGQGLFPCKWHEHVEAWLANPYQAEIIVIKYEELKSNTTRELQRFCDFVKLKRTPEFLQMIAEGTAFEKMRHRESVHGWNDPSWPSDKLFIRKGKVGGYKDEMPQDVLDVFLKEAKGALTKCNYV